jgi:hypothetical protein
MSTKLKLSVLMTEHKAKSELTERIVESKSFGNSSTYSNLLKYLVESTESGDVPKETTIGAHLFGSSATEDYDSAQVRVYIFNLRKKLTKYFENEGSPEPLVLTIPKGSYKVEYIKKSSILTTSNFAKYRATSVILLVLLGISIASNFLFLDQKKYLQESFEVLPETKVWQQFIEDDKPVLVVLGDLFIFTELNKETGITKTVRITEINSLDAYLSLKQNHNDTTIELGELSYTYLIKNTSDWIESLTKIFFSRHKDFQTRVISRMDTKDIHDHNIIFIGMQKTAGLFNNYFQNSKFDLADDATFVYQNGAETKRFTPIGDPDKYHTDYGFVAKYPGPNNNTIFMFGGLWDTAASQSLKNFTDPESLVRLEKRMMSKFGKIPDNFEILFEVSGIDRIELDTKVLYMNEIKILNGVWTTE